MKLFTVTLLVITGILSGSAQSVFPDALPLQKINYLSRTNTQEVYDTQTPEIKIFIFYNYLSETLAETMYNGCHFIFGKTKASIFPVFFTGHLIKKPTVSFGNPIPIQLQAIPLTSPFKAFNLSESEFPLLVVYNGKNQLCGIAKNIEQIAEIDCDEETVVQSHFLYLKLMVHEKNKPQLPYANKPVTIVGKRNNDTIVQLMTDRYGDFSIKIPDLEQSYAIVANEKIDEADSLTIQSIEGEQIGRFTNTADEYEYLINQQYLQLMPANYKQEDVEQRFLELKEKTPDHVVMTMNAHYQQGESALTPRAIIFLNKIQKVLLANPRYKLTIVSHTDARGNEPENLDVSTKRSDAMVRYLMALGIKKEKVRGEGKGESAIRNRCLNDVDCSAKEHEYNNRTEFKFTKK